MVSLSNKSKYSSTIQKFPQFSKISADNVRASAPFSMSDFQIHNANFFIRKICIYFSPWMCVGHYIQNVVLLVEKRSDNVAPKKFKSFISVFRDTFL